MQDYDIVKSLGEGASGEVFLVRHRQSNERFAMKVIRTTVESPQITDQTLKEVALMKSLSHPNIVSYRDSFRDASKLYIVMEFVDGGDLATFIADRNGRPLTEDDILHLFIQLIIAIQYIHEHKVIHRDIKPQNLFLTRVGVLKMGDFGVSRTLDSSQDLARTRIGTPYYLAPEIWNGQPYNSQADIWSAGCILYELCALKRPFHGPHINQLFCQVLQGRYEPLTTRYTEGLRGLVAKMLSVSPSDRPSGDAILQLPFVKNRVCAMIKANESQLNTVHIVSSQADGKTIKKRSRKRGRRRANDPEIVSEDTELPLPDEELPKWAQKSMREAKKGVIVVADDAEEENETNEWEELSNATDVLRESLGQIPDRDELDDAEADAEAQRLREDLIGRLGQELFEMLIENLELEGSESARGFLEIMQESDPEAVRDARKMLELEQDE
jgi:NIMA (never in mitosis gene a)-related kinase